MGERLGRKEVALIECEIKRKKWVSHEKLYYRHSILVSVFCWRKAQVADTLNLLEDTQEPIQLLPESMMLTQKALYGEKGPLRITGIAPLIPEGRTNELEERRAMLVAHQVVGYSALDGKIRLACIYILVGDRLGFGIRGINPPGHFLARATVARKPYVVDCSNGGRFLDESDIANFNPKSPVHMKDILALECSSDTIIARVLRNLANSYKHAGNLVNSKFMTELLEMINLGDDETES